MSKLREIIRKVIKEENDQWDAAMKKTHPVQDQWHYKIMVKYGFKPIDQEKTGMVRQYGYKNSKGYIINVSTGANADHWSDPQTKDFGYWSSLEPHLNALKK